MKRCIGLKASFNYEVSLRPCQLIDINVIFFASIPMHNLRRWQRKACAHSRKTRDHVTPTYGASTMTAIKIAVYPSSLAAAWATGTTSTQAPSATDTAGPTSLRTSMSYWTESCATSLWTRATAALRTAAAPKRRARRWRCGSTTMCKRSSACVFTTTAAAATTTTSAQWLAAISPALGSRPKLPTQPPAVQSPSSAAAVFSASKTDAKSVNAIAWQFETVPLWCLQSPSAQQRCCFGRASERSWL